MKRAHDGNTDDGNVTTQCAICMEPLAASGSHRVVSLRCGHLFGRGCILSWIDVRKSNAQCPNCKAKVRKQDLRNLFTASVAVVDSAQRDELARELHDTKRELNALALRFDVLAQKYEKLKRTKMELEQHSKAPVPRAAGEGPARVARLEPYARVDLAGAGRVSHHMARDSSLLFSSGARIGRVSLLVGANPNTVSWFSVHERDSSVRDMCTRARDDLVLSCGTASELAIWDLASGNVVARLARPAVAAVAWDPVDAHRLYFAQRNQVHALDTRRLAQPMAVPWTLPHPQPVQRLIVVAPAAQQRDQQAASPLIWASSMGGVSLLMAGADAVTPIVDGTVYSLAVDGDRMVCSFRSGAEGAPATHVPFQAGARGAWVPPATMSSPSCVARWPNVLLSRTALAGKLFAAGDGDVVRVWDVAASDAPPMPVVEAPLSGPATDANVFVERSSKHTFVSAVTQSEINIWRLTSQGGQSK